MRPVLEHDVNVVGDGAVVLVVALWDPINQTVVF